MEISNYTNCSLVGGVSTIKNDFLELANLNDELIYDRSFSSKKPVNVTRLSNNALYIILDELEEKERAVYQYEIIPKGPGIHETYTIIRSKNRPDLDHSFAIDFKDPNPKFDVKLNINNLEESFNKQINITYDIIYLGGDAHTCNYNIRLDEPIDYMITNHGSLPRDFKFDSTSSKNFTITIEYPYNKGSIIKQFLPYHAVYTLPGIWIGDRHYPFDERINVDTFSYRYIQILAFLSGFLGLILVEIGFLSTMRRWYPIRIRQIRHFSGCVCNKSTYAKGVNYRIWRKWVKIKIYIKRKLR